MKKLILSLRQLAVGHGEILITDITDTLARGDRVGILGPNGSGKSTLLGTIAGRYEPEQGSIMAPEFLQWVAQGIPNHDARLSGGEELMKRLTDAFSSGAELILLDEPTNHLDLNARKKLITLIKDYPGAIICVSHDAWFLEEITNRLWIVKDGKIRIFTGTYTQFEEEMGRHEAARERNLEVAQKELDRVHRAEEREAKRAARSVRIGKQAKFDRSMTRMERGYFKEQAAATASKNKRANDRRKEEMLQKMAVLKKVSRRRVLSSLPETTKKGTILRIREGDLTVEGHTLLRRVSFDVAHGDRIALVGANGSGKSALVKAIIGMPGFQLAPQVQKTVGRRMVYLDQHYSMIDRSRSVIENAARFSPLPIEEIRERLSHFLFSGEHEISKPAKNLSGGMLARLAMVMITLAPIDLLILDEPTNNLDRETIQALVDMVNEFSGGLMVISHDIRFLDSIHLTKLAQIDNGLWHEPVSIEGSIIDML